MHVNAVIFNKYILPLVKLQKFTAGGHFCSSSRLPSEVKAKAVCVCEFLKWPEIEFIYSSQLKDDFKYGTVTLLTGFALSLL